METPAPFSGALPSSLSTPQPPAQDVFASSGLLPLGLRVESVLICKGREGRKEGFCLVKQGERRESKERELRGCK